MKRSIKNSTVSFLMILFSMGLTTYFTIIILNFPLIGIEVKEKNDLWVIERIHSNGWTSNQSIEVGTIVELVNGEIPEKHTTVTHFNRIEMANSITILDNHLKSKTFSISYSHLSAQQIIYLLSPFLFSVLTISLSIFLYRKKKEEKSAIILIYFLLSLGVSYLSASGATRGDIIARVINTITLSGSLILFIHFIKQYLIRFDLVFIKTQTLTVLYVLYFTVLTLMTSSLIFYKVDFHIQGIQLLFFLLLLCYLLFHLLWFYMKYRNSQGSNVLKILWTTLFLSLSPFVFLYLIPNVFFNKELIPAETTAVFLIFIPIAFVYLQLAEKLFDIEFLLNRLRYYSLLSLPFTILSVILLHFIVDIGFFSSKTAVMFSLLFLTSILFLYAKEYLDYKIRRHLFSPKGNFETSLYTFFQRAKYETKVSSLVTNLMNEIKDVLIVKKVLHIELIMNSEKWVLKNRDIYPYAFVETMEKIEWHNHQIGSLIDMSDGFGIVIGGDHNNRNIIFCDMKKSKTKLNIQEKIWLETLAYFSSILLENFQLIEGLFEKIEHYNKKKPEENDNYPYWLSRLLFTLSEKERANLSIDLHDSVLQDQLQLLREVEKIKEKSTDLSIQNDLFELKERMLDNIHLIRETCNELRPPFLSELGIIQSIQNLFDQTKLRCNFILKSELDHSIDSLDKEVELALYRVVQELLTNAMKHSLASEVKVSLYKNNQNLFLLYIDNGIGIDMTKLNDSFKTMGIFGIKERIKSIGGTIEINSTPGKGTQIIIKIRR